MNLTRRILLLLPQRFGWPLHSTVRTCCAALVAASIALLCCVPHSTAAPPPKAAETNPPKVLREMRGAWIATVANLDWPSRPGLSTAEQKAELLAIFDKAVQLNLNVMILQVRPACDAFYASRIEPWSEFLTGKMGQAPDPYYDPLAFAITEAHRRGLELHAWFNPFRVRAPIFKGGAAANYVTRSRPQFVRTYGSQLWLDPGMPAVQDYSTGIILDVVKRYNIDGVHLDDYFYPYPEKTAAGQILDFPDASTWQRYRGHGGKLTQADWRRKNVDDFVENLYAKIKGEKRWVKVGISPFGIWRLGAPLEVKKGLDAYEYLFADSRKWLINGWADYFAPQLYWPLEGDQSYGALLRWWAAQNTRARHLCPGNDLTKVGSAWVSNEIEKQIRLTRKQSGVNGNILWNASTLTRNKDGIADRLARDLFAQPALVPAVPWLNGSLPAKPVLFLSASNPKTLQLSWTNRGAKEVWLWLFQSRIGGKWTTRIFPSERASCPLPARSSASFPDLVAVTPIDRCGGAGPTALLNTKPTPPTQKPSSAVAKHSDD